MANTSRERFSRSTRTRATRAALAVVLVAVLLACGCAKKNRRLPVFPAQGRLLVNDKPASGALVYLWPESIGAGLDAYCPNGQTDENGNFTLSTYDTGDGAPAGTYKVTVEWPVRYNMISGQWEGDKLNGKYKSLGDSRIQVTIEKRRNELATIELKP